MFVRREKETVEQNGKKKLFDRSRRERYKANEWQLKRFFEMRGEMELGSFRPFSKRISRAID